MALNLIFSTSGASSRNNIPQEDNREVGALAVSGLHLQSAGQPNAAPATVIGEVRLTTVETTGLRGKEMNQVSASWYAP